MLACVRPSTNYRFLFDETKTAAIKMCEIASVKCTQSHFFFLQLSFLLLVLIKFFLCIPSLIDNLFGLVEKRILYQAASKVILYFCLLFDVKFCFPCVAI